MNLKTSFALAPMLLASALFAADVTFKEDSIVLPTYQPGGYDKTPIFYTGRVYQGAQGRVYPYPMQDVLHDEKVDEAYKYLTLENEWLQMGLLPEHGGHLLNFTDKATGFEAFYRQHVIKPALIGMLGAWISGGVEWNFPHHHRATTAMPIDWRATDDPEAFGNYDAPKGTKTVWIGETELRRRLKWTIGLSLLPDRAVLQADNRFMNRSPFIESMIYWANVSVHCGDDYQILFPPSCHLGFDHHKNYWTSFPIGPRKEEVELLPSQRSKYADDISGTMDLSWWRNFTIESRSIFAMDPDNAWLAGYDHKRECGTAHVSNRHITVGKKFFLWGNFPEAHVWDTVLTDHDGPYLELMVGCWSDNQPDYSWIAPYETRRVKQYWFPVKGIGGVKNVTIDGAVNVERRASDKMLMGFHSTRELTDCEVELVAKDVGVVYCENRIAIGPNSPWCKVVNIEERFSDTNLTAQIKDGNGKVFLSYTPVGPDPHDPLPPKVENPKDPKEYASAELAYEVGLRLDQFQNGILDPEPYYNRALEIDPDYTRANLAMGVRRLKNGMYTAAKPYLEKAVKRATQNHTRALDAAPEYYLALCERSLGNPKRAEDLFWRCTWRSSYKKEAFFEIVRLYLLQNRLREAHDVIEFSVMPLAMDEAKVHTMHAYIHRKLKDSPEATAMQKTKWAELASNNQKLAFKCDPLEYWGVCESAFRESGKANCASGRAALTAAEKNRGLKAQQLLEAVCDYWGIGAWDEVIALCDAALEKAAAEKPYRTEGALSLKETLAACDSYKNPLFGYFKTFALARRSRSEVKGKMSEDVAKALTEAGAMSGDYCFPSRLEELAVLQWAAASSVSNNQTTKQSNNSSTLFFLGEILWNLDQKDAAIDVWKTAVARNPKHALAWRCLGFALAHPGTYFTNTGVPSGIASREAYDCYLKSLEADPENFRTLDEAGKLAEKLKLPAPERLALMLKYPKACAKYDANMLRLAYCYNAVGEYAKAHEILTTRRFHVWEGADGLLAPFVEACIGLGRQAMAETNYTTALKYFEESTTYPANLQAGRPGDAGTEPKSRYYMAQCKRALGDAAGCKAELEKSLKGWIHAGEMDYWRVKALRELGREAECAPLVAELKQAIRELETPQPTIINAYAKFAGDNSAMERAAKAREQADSLKALLAELETAQ